MNVPGRTMWPLPHSSIGAIPDAPTPAQIAEQVNRVQTIGRSAVGNEAARKLLGMVQRYAETFQTVPGQRTVPDMKESTLATPPSDQERTLDQVRQLAESRAMALTAANARVATLTKDIATGHRDLEVARAEANRLSAALNDARAERDAAPQSTEALEATQAEVTRLLGELDSARNDVETLRWLHAEAMHWLDSAHVVADYHAAQATRRNDELDRVRGAALVTVRELQEQREDLLGRAVRFRTAWLSARTRAARIRAEGLEARLRWAESTAELAVRLRVAEEEASGRADLDREIAQLEAELAPHRTLRSHPTLILTDEQVEQLRAEWEAGIAQPLEVKRIEGMDSPALPNVASLDTEDSKRCSACEQVKPLEEFHLRSKTDPAGRRHSVCRDCTSARQHARRVGQRGES